MIKKPHAAFEPKVGEVSAKEKSVQLTLPLRADLHRALRVRAAKQGTTMRVIVLHALRAAGFPVEEADLADRRPDRGNRSARKNLKDLRQLKGPGSDFVSAVETLIDKSKNKNC